MQMGKGNITEIRQHLEGHVGNRVQISANKGAKAHCYARRRFRVYVPLCFHGTGKRGTRKLRASSDLHVF